MSLVDHPMMRITEKKSLYDNLNQATFSYHAFYLDGTDKDDSITDLRLVLTVQRLRSVRHHNPVHL